MKRLQRERQRLQQVADDEAVDAGILRYGRKAVALEERLQALQSELRRQIHSNSDEGKTDAAALRIQTAQRAHTARRVTSLRLLDRLLRVWSPSVGRGSLPSYPCGVRV